MGNKKLRLNQIQKIIQNEDITSQEDLLERLNSSGFSLTQATLSRDLKFLKVAKIPNQSGLYVYTLAKSNSGSQNALINQNKPEGFLSIEFSGNIEVIKTTPAFSHTIASTIDSLDIRSISGTIAGNDTIFFVVRENFSISDVKSDLMKKFPDIIDKLK